MKYKIVWHKLIWGTLMLFAFAGAISFIVDNWMTGQSYESIMFGALLLLMIVKFIVPEVDFQGMFILKKQKGGK